ncbi:MAG: TetR/AcrR family transcriptional regulator [Ilumatobacteraceae bacterium]
MGEIQETSRERIHQCTLAEIEQSGIVGLRVAHIAEAAEVSVALVYKYYKDRDGLLAAVLGKEIANYYLEDVRRIRALVESNVTVTIDVLMQALPMPEEVERIARRALRMQIFAASEELPQLRKALGEAQKTIHDAVCDLMNDVRKRSGATSPISTDVISFAVQAMGFSFGFNDVMVDKPLNNANYSAFMRDFLTRYLLT